MTRTLFRALLLLGAIAPPNSGRIYAQAGRTPLSAERLAFRVRVYNDEWIPGGDLSAAQKIADAALERAGLRVMWQECTVGNPNRDSSACDMHPTHIDLVVYLVFQLEAHAPNVGKSALGYSIIPGDGEYATMAYVCYGRVRTIGSVFSVGELLGMAIAHEIGHLLFNSNVHAKRGLMRAKWPRRDLEAGDWEEFTFTSDQVKRLRTAVQVRMKSQERASTK